VCSRGKTSKELQKKCSTQNWEFLVIWNNFTWSRRYSDIGKFSFLNLGKIWAGLLAARTQIFKYVEQLHMLTLIPICESTWGSQYYKVIHFTTHCAYKKYYAIHRRFINFDNKKNFSAEFH